VFGAEKIMDLHWKNVFSFSFCSKYS